MKPEQKPRVLLEMRPALDGFAGIPQETRLLFRGLCLLESVTVEGLLQMSLGFMAPGMPAGRPALARPAEAARLNRYARVVMSLAGKPAKSRFAVVDLYLRRRREAFLLALRSMLGPVRHQVKLSVFEPLGFELFIWQSLFAKTLPAADFGLVTRQGYRVCTVPWNIMQSAGLNTLKWVSKPVYPKLDTRGMDVFVTQTPYPGRVAAGTALVVRYHDALPVFMPHAFANMTRHHATHFHALQSNVRSGAYFSCVSEATRQDLLKVFPEVAERSVTIHNMVSPHYFKEESSAHRVPEIVRTRINLQAPAAHPAFRSLGEQEDFYRQHLGVQPFNYLLMVSTIEPRKNHSRLIAAWEALRAAHEPGLKLVIVGGMGWDVEPIMREMRSWIDRGALFVLHNVPASDLRVLYRHAQATVCPSLAEGFDFSGVEAMRSGGITIASDIAVHREVYAEAAVYFDPHSTESLLGSLKDVLYSANGLQVQQALRAEGEEVAARYLPEAILPQWDGFLKQVADGERVCPHPGC